MPCDRFGGAIICYRNQYKFPHNGRTYYFEVHPYCGPMPLKCVGREWYEPRKNVPSGFWDAYSKFENLSEVEKKRFIL